MEEIIKRIQDYALEEIMGDRFGKYAKEIIQDRAIPDVRDGLKPVQRRILYAMYKAGNTHEKGYIKCAATVGDVLGKFHPHGDSSVYDAMVRMSQWWKQNTILVDIHGNNGSMDGDGAAAYRYTEARLAKISSELLKDLDKNTVVWAPNFDDRFMEPTVLPAKFPNLLVNGTNGISAGYATNIPPHNLGEVIDATIKRIDSPNCRLDTILDIVKGPDFPTGGIVEGKQGIIDAFTTGKGKVIIKSKTEFVKEKGKEQIIVHEIPFDVNKANLVNKIDAIRIDKKIEGIAEVRDESDREGLRIAIDLKSGADKETILNYLLKNTDLQISYAYNMVAIVNRRPMTLGILELLDAYIAHEREVIIKRTEFDLKHAKKKLEIAEGFIKMVSILDEVIATIRASENKTNAKENLIKKFNFTELQAETIVTLQLYKLTNTDVLAVEEERKNLLIIIKALEAILTDEEKLKHVMKEELRNIKKEYGTSRKTEIHDEITEIKIDTTSMIPKEDCIVVVTNEGYLKRVSKRSFGAADGNTTLKDGDYVIGLYEMNTLDTLLLFTDMGNYLFIPVHEIPELKWKELGKHVSNVIKIDPGENIIYSIAVKDFEKEEYVTLVSKTGMIKRTKLGEFKIQRYSKPVTCMKLKDDDKVVSICNSKKSEILIITKLGYGLRYDISEVAPTGVKSAGIKAISLKGDEVVSAHLINDTDDYLAIITEKNTGKRIKLSDIEKLSRARKGILVIRDVKTNPYYIFKTFVVNSRTTLMIQIGNDFKQIKVSELSILDRYSTGSSLSKANIKNVFLETKLVEEEIVEIDECEEKEISLENVDKKIMTIDDFLDEFNIDSNN
ncbi:MAG: DNA topoisomerase IV subunit A [Firmicutes bacterium]|nr:DNA topoisomerase IV subunit A [Bacillota bacterium]